MVMDYKSINEVVTNIMVRFMNILYLGLILSNLINKGQYIDILDRPPPLFLHNNINFHLK